MALRDYMYAKHIDRDIVNKINTTGEQPRTPIEHKPKTFRVVHRSKSPKGRKSIQQQQLQEITSKKTTILSSVHPLADSNTHEEPHCTPSTCRNCPSCDHKKSHVTLKDEELESNLATIPIIYQEEVAGTTSIQNHFKEMKLDEIDFTHIY